MSIIVTQSLSWEIESNAFLKSTKHIKSDCWCTRDLCISSRGGGERVALLIATKYPHMLYNDSAKWRV